MSKEGQPILKVKTNKEMEIFINAYIIINRIRGINIFRKLNASQRK